MTQQDKVNRKFAMKHKWPEVPLTKDGDPKFVHLLQVQQVFTDDEIVQLVNKALYKLKYEDEYHKRRYEPKGSIHVPSNEVRVEAEKALAKALAEGSNLFRKKND